ncbi:MAG: hypothetical protein RR140_02885 [Clostridia bacterium]
MKHEYIPYCEGEYYLMKNSKCNCGGCPDYPSFPDYPDGCRLCPPCSFPPHEHPKKHPCPPEKPCVPLLSENCCLKKQFCLFLAGLVVGELFK